MYSRQIYEKPEHIIVNGKANFGTFSGVSPEIDIRGMRAPYAGIPLPTFLTRIRIKSKIDYIFSLEKFIGMSRFFDFKVFGLGEITLWNKTSGKKYAYHVIMPARRRFVPVTTTRGICASYRKSRYIKISWGRKHQHHALSFKIKGDSVRPNVEGYCYSPMQDEMHCDMMFVNPSPSSSRCSATWFSSMSTSGHVLINNEEKEVDDSQGLAAMLLSRSYFKFRTHSRNIYGIGFLKERKIIFSLGVSDLDSADSDSFNSNILIVDGNPTPLPPVYVTHPFGIKEKWIIQDTESMIDLTFNPVSINSRVLNIIAFRTSYSTIYGTFDGVLLTKEGEKIILKNFPGILQTDHIRL